jgi:hypothetical protein
MRHKKKLYFPLGEKETRGIDIFPLNFFLRNISNRDNSKISHIAHKEL